MDETAAPPEPARDDAGETETSPPASDSRPTLDKADFDRVTSFIIQLGAAARTYGAGSPQLAAYMHRLRQVANIDAHHLFTTSYIWHIFCYPGEVWQFGYLDRVIGKSFNLGKLAKLSAVVDQVCELEITLAAAFKELKQLAADPDDYNPWIVAIGYFSSAAGFAVILNTTFFAAALSGLLSLVVFALTLLTAGSKWITDTFEFLSALVVGALACLVAVYLPEVDYVSVALAGIVVLIPGYTLTVGVGELMDRQILTGSEGLVKGLLTAVQLVFGASIGATFVAWVFGHPIEATAVEYSTSLLLISAAILTFGLALVFQVSPRDLLWAITGGVIAYSGTQIGAVWGDWQGPFIGSLLLALFGALYSVLTRRPAIVVNLTAIMVLVPGASAILGMSLVREGGVAEGLDVELNAVMTIFAIVAGQIIANTLLATREHR
ncbi:uncharacterized membrane protein YjjP (DUF1212 family) [Aliiruegeria haliotis]|uniref:Uncharacterized membrane protein YjjP (DUF1212 family) n=1 Tax=Aliiruegeria haliotis TaxID=1280846 RepID=A0A2T0RGJ9_9RHOB|nr:threonine/serine exporter family protein [Aliiruegeria haliotis]PRY20230.1 uncharacterized membrane protein YjjP (DUF1212 family) [Aliiruegeria haliotis]